MRNYRKNFYGRRTYEETPHFYISDMRAWPDKVLIIKGHAVDEGQHYVPESEVTKLRELVGIMRTCIKHACLCDFCPLFAAEDMDEPRCIAEMDSRMRELGVGE